MPLTLWPALVCLYLWALLLLGSWLWSLYALMEPAVEGGSRRAEPAECRGAALVAAPRRP